MVSVITKEFWQSWSIFSSQGTWEIPHWQRAGLQEHVKINPPCVSWPGLPWTLAVYANRPHCDSTAPGWTGDESPYRAGISLWPPGPQDLLSTSNRRDQGPAMGNGGGWGVVRCYLASTRASSITAHLWAISFSFVWQSKFRWRVEAFYRYANQCREPPTPTPSSLLYWLFSFSYSGGRRACIHWNCSRAGKYYSMTLKNQRAEVVNLTSSPIPLNKRFKKQPVWLMLWPCCLEPGRCETHFVSPSDQFLLITCVDYICLHRIRHMLGEFCSHAALEQQSHRQTALLSRESAIRLCRTASVLQQAINTESIIAPRGATGQGDRERHHLKGQSLERKWGGRMWWKLGDTSEEDREEGVSCLRPNGV